MTTSAPVAGSRVLWRRRESWSLFETASKRNWPVWLHRETHMIQSDQSEAAPKRSPASSATSAPSGDSLNVLMRSVLLDCPSKQAMFQKLLTICAEQFPASVARVDFKIGDKSNRKKLQ